MSEEAAGSNVDEYEAIIPGKLKLRSSGGGAVVVSKKDKKSKKKKDKKKKDKKKKSKKRSREASEEEEAAGQVERAVGGASLVPVQQPTMTEAERKFLEQKKKREAEVLKKVAVKSHRERVAEFNERLSTLTEHFDLPRIGPG